MFLLHRVEDRAEGRAIERVAGEHCVSEWKPFGRDHEGQHHLQAVGPVVAAVAAFGRRHAGGFAFKTGARQIVEEHIAGGAEQVAPLLGEVLLERGLVRPEAIEAAVEPVLARDRRVGVEEQVHRGLGEPFSCT